MRRTGRWALKVIKAPFKIIIALFEILTEAID